MTPSVNTGGCVVKPNPNQSQTAQPGSSSTAWEGTSQRLEQGRNTLSTERKKHGVAEKRWEMQTPEKMQMPCLVPLSIGGSVAEQRMRAELQVAFPGKGNPILYQL